MELRTAHPARPYELSEPLAVYDTPMWNEQTKFFTVFLDRETDTWLLYRSNWDDQIVVHTAPAR